MSPRPRDTVAALAESPVSLSESMAWLMGVSRRAGSAEAAHGRALLDALEQVAPLRFRWIGPNLFAGPFRAGHLAPEGGMYESATRWKWYTTWTGLSEKWVSKRTAMRQLKAAVKEALLAGQGP